jgi:hypothetical protein
MPALASRWDGSSTATPTATNRIWEIPEQTFLTDVAGMDRLSNYRPQGKRRKTIMDAKDRRVNNCRTSEGDSPIFVKRKLGQFPTYSFVDPKAPSLSAIRGFLPFAGIFWEKRLFRCLK